MAVTATPVRRSRRKRRIVWPKLPPLDLRRSYTYEELSTLIDEDHGPYELWDGELIMSPTPEYRHQKAVMFIARHLEDHVRAKSLGEVIISPFDMVLAPRRSFQPDVLFVSKARLSLIDKVLRGPADLVVEVISPFHRRRDRIDKRDLYALHGIPEYWMIDLEASTIEVLTLVRGEYTLHGRFSPGEHAQSQLLPGFALDVAALFHG